jgi:hypothetical protein
MMAIVTVVQPVPMRDLLNVPAASILLYLKTAETHKLAAPPSRKEVAHEKNLRRKMIFIIHILIPIWWG